MIFTSALVLLALQQSPALKVDPLLIRQAAETWSIIGNAKNPIWEGWNARDTPLLIYMPGVQDVLINHPKPPAGFLPYTGPVQFPAGKIFIHDGSTLVEFDGQNTSMDIAGVTSLVLADTMSTRRQNLESLVAQGRQTPDMKDAIDNMLQNDPYGGMAMTVHEAFHVFQHRSAPGKGGNELALTDYPCLSVGNNLDFALEADALHEALDAKTDAQARQAAERWLAVRMHRRHDLPQAGADYEDGTEFNEGLAKYTEYRLFQVLQGRQPSPDMWLIQGFRGYQDLAPQRKRLLDQMSSMMEGRTNVNNDPYGASPVRMRLYYSGMGVAALLDRLHVSWHDRILKPGSTLTGLATDAIGLDAKRAEALYADLTHTPRYTELKAKKETLAQEGAAYIAKVANDFDASPGLVVFDYSQLEKPRVGVAFTPFGLLRLDQDRIMYRLLPIRGLVNDMQFAEDSVRPAVQDRAKKHLVLSLTGPISESALDAAVPGWRTESVKADRLQLPGLEIKNLDGRLRLEGKTLIVEPSKAKD